MWEDEMRRFWECMNFQQFRIDILMNLGHGKFVDPQLLWSSKVEVTEFASFTVQQTRHLRNPSLCQRHLQSVQKLFPLMVLNKAIYYNPYLLTLSLNTLEHRKMALIDLIATHLTEATNIDKYNAAPPVESDTEWLSKGDVMELMEWDKLFENVSVYLTMDFGVIIKQIHVFKKLVCSHSMGLSPLEFVEVIECFPQMLRQDAFAFMAKFRFLVQFASAGILRRKRHFHDAAKVDLTMLGNESRFHEELSFDSYESMVSDPRIISAYQV